jgi:retron-type reverse transcriptase
VRQALSTTSNKSAPGPSGITYKLLKWTFDANPDLIITTINGALEQGTHPWGTADVVVIPKPNKPDYSLAKAYRPISLLECTGKLLEKIVANRLGSDERNHHLIGPMQFGSRKYHSAPDAATLLRYKAEMTTRSGNIGGVLLLDISRFFDHLNPATTVATLADLGVDPTTCAWVYSFMTERTLRFTFNGEQSEPFRQDVGIPQGSPLSPILSALYTSPLLREALSWSSQDLALYVDDRCIYASAPTFSAVAQQLTTAASFLLSWLRRLGLTVDADKTELMFFHRHRISTKRNGAQVASITLSDGNTSFTVKRAAWIRYLGVFFTPTLDWTLHVRTLANRARSTVRALGVLGNSIRGFSLLSWRRIFVGIILPIFTYASQVWFTDQKQKSLIHHLQIAQNDACRKLAGVFRTTPVHLTEKLLNIPPVRYRFRHLLRNAGARLARLPSDCTIRSLERTRPVMCIPRHVPLPPILPTCAETPPLLDTPFTYPLHPSTPTWHDPSFTIHPRSQNKRNTVNPSKTVILNNTAHIKIFFAATLSPSLHLKSVTYAVFLHHRLILSDIHSAPTTQAAYLTCLEAAFTKAPPSTDVLFFYADSSLPKFIFNHRTLPNLSLIIKLTDTLSSIFSSRPFTKITGHWYSQSWSWPWKTDWKAPLLERATFEYIHNPSPIPSKVRMFEEWNEDYEARDSDPPYLPFTQPSTPDHLHPFVQGVLEHDSRRLQCAAFQIITGHSFQADYSLRHRPTAPDTIICPLCSPDRICNLVHILVVCRHHAIHRNRLIINHSLSFHTIFSTTIGGRRLCEFLKATNALLRPLPPRPDQPRDPT